MTQKTRKFKINIVDVIIIITLIGIIVGMVIRYDLADTVGINMNKDTIQATFIVQNIQEDSQNYIKEGTKWYYEIEGLDFGTLDKIIDTRRAVQFAEMVDGTLSKTELPGRIDVTGVFTCAGKKTKEGFMINGNTFIAAGKIFLLHSDNLTISVTILNINDTATK